MIKQSGPDKITVAKLVEKCQISRSLFYYYFNDIFDVMIYHLENDLNQAINASLKVNSPKDSWFFVGSAKTDTRDQRRKVLEQLIDTGLMTKAGIMSHIEWLISIRKNMPSMVRPATVGEMEAFLKLKKIVDHEDWSPVRGVHQVG